MEDNWNVPRKAKMQTVLTDLTTLQTRMTAYDNSLKAVQANISSYATILQSNYNPITNLLSGSFNGLDCRVIG